MYPIRVVIVVDAEPSRREALTKSCAKSGVEVIATGDPFEAIARAASAKPDLFVLSTALGELLPAALLAALRRTAPEAVPIAIGEAATRGALLSAGAAEVLLAPPAGHELLWLAEIERRLRWQRAEATLAEMPLGEVLRALYAARRSAWISVERRDASSAAIRGELHLLRGELSAANIGRLRGARAMAHLLLWDAGRIEVSFLEPDAGEERRMNKATEVLLDEAERFAAQFRRNARQVGGTGAVYRRDEDKVPSVQGRIPTQVLDFLDRYDGRRSVLDIVADSPFQHFDTLMITYRLVELGAIVRAVDSDEADAARPTLPAPADAVTTAPARDAPAAPAPEAAVITAPLAPRIAPAFAEVAAVVAERPAASSAASPAAPVLAAAPPAAPVDVAATVPVFGVPAAPVAAAPATAAPADPADPAEASPAHPAAVAAAAAAHAKAPPPAPGRARSAVEADESRPFFLRHPPAAGRKGGRRGGASLVGTALADVRAAISGAGEPIAVVEPGNEIGPKDAPGPVDPAAPETAPPPSAAPTTGEPIAAPAAPSVTLDEGTTAPVVLVDAGEMSGEGASSSGVPVAIGAVQTLPFELLTEEELSDEQPAQAPAPRQTPKPPPLPAQKPPPLPLAPVRPPPVIASPTLALPFPDAQAAAATATASTTSGGMSPAGVPSIIVSWGSGPVHPELPAALAEQLPVVAPVDTTLGSAPIPLESAVVRSEPILLESVLDGSAQIVSQAATGKSVPILLEAAAVKTAPFPGAVAPVAPVAAVAPVAVVHAVTPVAPVVAPEAGATPRAIPPSLEMTQPIHVHREAVKAKEAALGGRAREATGGSAGRAADRAPRPKRDLTGRVVRTFDPVEEDFFARESDLLNVEAVDHFDDLIAEPVPESGSEVDNLRRWLPFGSTGKKSGRRGRKA